MHCRFAKHEKLSRVLYCLCLFLVVATALSASAQDDRSALARGEQSQEPSPAKAPKLKGAINIDGSSTLFPISEAVAEEFSKLHPGVRVAVGLSGTGGGFKKFTIGEIDISDASRPIKEGEAKTAKERGIEFVELPVAFDGLSIVVNPKNTFASDITLAELKKLWEPGSKVMKWSDLRAGWPSAPIKLFGPGTASGTFDYFTEVINGKTGASRGDYTQSEDDNVLVKGVEGELNALGYFGFAYYQENQAKLKALAVGEGAAAVLPSVKTINDGTYSPLSRPLFIYVSTAALKRPEVREFTKFYLTHAANLAKEVGYVPLPDKVYALAMERLTKDVAGSAYLGRDTKGKTLEQIYGQP
ncbi:MAG: PstS family phosphate ABC transporter substrate-binding protein [Planctomycetota bacterium]